MTQPLTLCLPQATFEDLHQAADGRGMFCRVNKQNLRALLIDHARVLAKLQDMHIEMKETDQ